MNDYKIKDSTADDMVWMSYRYCIGRHTIAAYMHASNLAKYIENNKSKLGNCIDFYSKDILESIDDVLRFCNDVFCNGFPEDLLKILMPFFNEGTNINYIIEYDGQVFKEERDSSEYTYSWKNTIHDLMPWYKLAKALKPEYEVVTNYKGKIGKYKAFKYYDRIGNELYQSVDEYFKDPFKESFIANEYITDINEKKY